MLRADKDALRTDVALEVVHLIERERQYWQQVAIVGCSAWIALAERRLSWQRGT